MYHHGNGSLEQLEEERRRYGIAPGYQPFNLTQPVFNRPIPTQTVYTQPTWPLPTTAASQNDPYLTSRSPAFNPSPNYQGWNGQGGQPSLPNNLFLPSRSPDFNPPSNYQRWDGRTDHPRLHSEETLLIRLPEKHWVCPNRNGCTKVFKRRHIMCPSCPMSKRKAPGRRKCVRLSLLSINFSKFLSPITFSLVFLPFPEFLSLEP